MYIYTRAQKKVATLTKWRPHDIQRIEIAEKTGQWADIELLCVAKTRNRKVAQTVS